MADEIRSGGRGRLQLYTSGRRRWTKEARTRFLDVLAVTANVRRAAEAAGLAAATVHRLRVRDPEFAALWATAIAQGYDRVEERLLAHTLQGDPVNAIDPRELGIGPAAEAAMAEDAAQPFDATLALKVVRIGRMKQAGRVANPGGPRRARSTQAELVAAIDKRLAMLARRDARKAAAETLVMGGRAGAVPPPVAAEVGGVPAPVAPVAPVAVVGGTVVEDEA